jgi:SET domain-containing protein
MGDPTVESLTSFFTNLLKDTTDYYELELKKEELLRMKLGLDIDKTCIKKSKVHGNGLFAKVKIKKGEIITFYPCDVMAYYPEKDREIVGYIFNEELKENEQVKKIFNDNRKFYKDYQFAVNNNYSIIGMPEITNNPAYLGHICNDGARGHSVKDKEIYEKISVLKSNAHYKIICDCIVAIVAMRNIEIDEEILITYGHGYWITRE